MSGIRVNEWLHNSGTGGIWQTSAGNVGIASSVPTTKLEVTGDAKVSGVSTAAAFIPAAGQLSNRNLVINGAMQVAQRGTTDSSSATGYKTVDRFRHGAGGADEHLTQSQHALTASDTGPWAQGFRYSYHLQNGNQTGGAGASDYAQLTHKMEAQDIASSGWDYTSSSSYITLSFWVKASVAKTYYVTVETGDGTAQLYCFSTGALSANTWTKVSKSIPGNSNITVNSDTGMGLNLIWNPFIGTTYTTSGHTINTWAAAGSYADMAPDMTSTWWTTNDSTFEITGVQLEVGTVATPFEHRSYGEDLSRCQRFFWLACDGTTGKPFSGVVLYSNTSARLNMQFPVTMRTIPTLYEVSGTDYWQIVVDGSSMTPDDIGDTIYASNQHAHVIVTDAVSSSGGKAGWIESNNSSAKFGFTAEI